MTSTSTSTSIVVAKHISDSDMEGMVGQFIDVDASASDWTVVRRPESMGVTSVHKANNAGLLCSIVWGSIPQDMCKLALRCYLDVGKTRYMSTNRGAAAGVVTRERTHVGTYSRGVAANSGIIGYINSANHKRPCRLTAFSRDHFDQYEMGLPFIKCIDDCFREHIPDAYRLQNAESERTSYRIADTAFSTVTVNYNFRTALHKDAGDFKEGFGNLVVLHDDSDDSVHTYVDTNRQIDRGGMLLFPQYKVAVKLGSGDFMAMDVHEWHCNSSIKLQPGQYRLSFVCYLRENMERCALVNQRLIAINGNLDGKPWDTEKIVTYIVGEGATRQLNGTGPPPWNIQWWTLTSADGRFHLEYKNKRYVLSDRVAGVKISNLISAWDYCNQLQHLT